MNQTPDQALEDRANQDSELEWDPEQCLCENNGDYCEYCARFFEESDEQRSNGFNIRF